MQIHPVVKLALALWVLSAAILLLLAVLSGCELVRRPPIVTRGIAAEVREKEAEAAVLEAHAYLVHVQAQCLEAKYPKSIPSVAEANRECGIVLPSPVQVTRSEKTGEVPRTTFSLAPSIGMGELGTIVEVTQ